MENLNLKQLNALDAHVKEKLKIKETLLLALSKAEKDGSKYTLVSAVDKIAPNIASEALVVDEEGRLFTEKELLTKFKKDIFLSPIVFPGTTRFNVPTVSPTVNDLIINQCDTFGERLTVNIPKNPFRNVDIYFLADTTGSMGGSLNSVKSNINSLMSSIGAIPGISVAFGAGNYKNFISDPYCFKNDANIGSSAAVINAAVSSWSAGGGADGSEGQLFALTKLTDNAIGWRPNSLQIIVWFGDAPGHDPICPSISPLVGATPITENSTINALLGTNKRVLAVSVNPAYGLDANPTLSANNYPATCTPGGTPGQATRITTATQGAYQNGINANNTANAILNLIQNYLAFIKNVKIVPSSSIIPFICSINPNAGYNNLDASKDHKLEFIVCFKGKVPCGAKDRRIKGTFDVLMDGVLVAKKLVYIEVPACKSKGKCSCGCC